jgi:predicted oxidoreductase
VIQIDSAGLSEIYDAGQTVTLARQVNQIVDAVASARGSADASQLIVAWLAFAPLETNTIGWSEQYYCFATTTSLTMGEVLEMNSQSAASMQPGSVYTFDQGQFSAYPGSGSDYVV